MLRIRKVKTGTTKVTGEDSFKLIRTLDFNLWFEGKYHEQRKRLIEELRSHRSDIQILTILVVTSLKVDEFFARKKNLHFGFARLQELVCRHSMASEDEVRNTEQQKAQAEYTRAKKTVEKLIDETQKKTTSDYIFQAAKTEIIKKKGPNLQATRVTTIIRQALGFSQEGFSPRLVN